MSMILKARRTNVSRTVVAHDELPEDANEKNYRAKRPDKFKGPEASLFDIADHSWIGAAPVKQAAE